MMIDISMPLHSAMVVWPGQPGRSSGGEKFGREEIKAGDSIISLLSMSSHTGTHVDAPKHFLGESGSSLDQIPLEKLVGPCRVIEIQEMAITAEVLRPCNIAVGERILFKTRNSHEHLLEKGEFIKDYVSLDLSAAEFLASKKINLVGIDYLGIEVKGNPGHPVHKTLLEVGIVIVEGLNLVGVELGEYNLAVLPLKIADGDGAPARAILWK